MKEWAPLEVEIYKELFQRRRTGNYDIYVVFIEQGLKLLNAKGRLGFICPHKFFNSKYGEPVRAIVAEGQASFACRPLRRPTGFRGRDNLYLPAVPGQVASVEMPVCQG